MTPDEAYAHLKETFDLNCRWFPDVMEPYAIRAADLTDRSDLTEVMRSALRETFTQRFPLRSANPEAA
jgi:hypothetical protein